MMLSHQSEELRKKMRGKARGEAAMKSTRQAPKSPWKNINKKANNAESVVKLSRHLWLQWKLVSVYEKFYVYYMY